MALSDLFAAELMKSFREGAEGVSKSYVSQKQAALEAEQKRKQTMEDLLAKAYADRMQKARLYVPGTAATPVEPYFESPTGRTITEKPAIPEKTLGIVDIPDILGGQYTGLREEEFKKDETGLVPVYIRYTDDKGNIVKSHYKGMGKVDEFRSLTQPRETTAQRQASISEAKLSKIEPIVNYVEQEINKIPVGEGVPGRLKGLGLEAAGFIGFESGTEAKAYGAILDGVSIQLVKAFGEVGNLSQSEREAARDMLPKVSDNEGVRRAKISKLRSYLTEIMKTKLALYGDDFSGDMPQVGGVLDGAEILNVQEIK